MDVRARQGARGPDAARSVGVARRGGAATAEGCAVAACREHVPEDGASLPHILACMLAGADANECIYVESSTCAVLARRAARGLGDEDGRGVAADGAFAAHGCVVRVGAWARAVVSRSAAGRLVCVPDIG